MTMLINMPKMVAPIAALMFQSRIFGSRIFQTKGLNPSSFIQSIENSNINEIQAITPDTISAIESKLISSHNASQMKYQFHNFYLPLYSYVLQKRRSIFNEYSNKFHLDSDKSIPTLFIGISAPQGCGKTTLTEYMKILFESVGLSCLSISLDDFYLTGKEQDEVALTHSKNPLLQYRGNAGTHDVKLLVSTLQSIATTGHTKRNSYAHTDSYSDNVSNDSSTTMTMTKSATEGGIKVPKYDKSLRNGRGGRVSDDQWTVIPAGQAVDIVLLEGWMLGFEPLDSIQLQQQLSHSLPQQGQQQNNDVLKAGVEEINELLKSYKLVHEMMDMWVVLAVEGNPSHGSTSSTCSNGESNNSDDSGTNSNSNSNSSSNDTAEAGAGAGQAMEELVFKWRMQAEDQMRHSGRPALTRDEVRDFVSRFMPAYAAYLPRLYRYGPQRRPALVTAAPAGSSHSTGKSDDHSCIPSTDTTATDTASTAAAAQCAQSGVSSGDDIPVLKVVVDEWRAPVRFYEL